MAVARITKRVLDRLHAPQKGERWLWDRDLKGFGVKVLPSGRKVYAVKYRVPGDRVTRKFTLGLHGALTPDQARARATQVLASATRGEDPGRDRSARKAAPTVAELAPDYLASVRARRRPRTADQYERQLEAYLLPELGSTKVADVTRAQISRLHLRLRETPYQANRVLAMCSAFFTWAIRHGYRPDQANPCRLVERFPEEGRERFLSLEEYRRLGAALKVAETEGLPLEGDALENARKYGFAERTLPNPMAVAAIRLLLFTGCRFSEIVTLRWKDVDEERRILTLRESKTGKGERPLNLPALEVLRGLPREAGSPFVFPGIKRKAPLTSVRRLWHRIREHAGLKDVRLHDLRHSFASVGAAAGASLPIIGGLLGHTQARTTQRYAHLANDPLHAAAEATAVEVAAALEGKRTVVTPLRKDGLRRA